MLELRCAFHVQYSGYACPSTDNATSVLELALSVRDSEHESEKTNLADRQFFDRLSLERVSGRNCNPVEAKVVKETIYTCERTRETFDHKGKTNRIPSRLHNSMTFPVPGRRNLVVLFDWDDLIDVENAEISRGQGPPAHCQVYHSRRRRL
jgi:hypothetical protein